MTVGVDIGDYSVQVAHLEGREVIQVDSHEYPGWPQNTREQRVNTLSRMVEELRISGKFAWGAIYGRPVLTRLSQFPSMSEEELQDAVYLEAEQLQSCELSEVDVDYEVLEELPEGSKQVLIVTAPRRQSDDLLNMLQEAGLRCRGITVNTVALANEILQMPGAEERSTLLLDLGSTNTSILVQDRGKLKVLRDVSFGARQITEAVAEDLGMEDLGKAETAKRAYTESTEEFMASLRRCIQPLSTEIRRTVGHVRRSLGGLSELSLYLAGGGSLTPGLRRYLSEHLELEVDYLDPFDGLRARCELPGDPTHRASYSVAVGAAWIGENTS